MGKLNGCGVILFATGDIYEGDFKDDKKSGYGEEI